MRYLLVGWGSSAPRASSDTLGDNHSFAEGDVRPYLHRGRDPWLDEHGDVVPWWSELLGTVFLMLAWLPMAAILSTIDGHLVEKRR